MLVTQERLLVDKEAWLNCHTITSQCIPVRVLLSAICYRTNSLLILFFCCVCVCVCVAEENRIYKAGGWVEFNRVNGNLALSRAIGDFNFKSNNRLKPEEQIITGRPFDL